jgi:S-formylglutathione hydrolase FrmB
MIRVVRAAWKTSLIVICAMGTFSAAGMLLHPAQAQFGEDRRRGELNPIGLPGGSVVEFHSFTSEAIGTSEAYSVFLPPSYARESSRKYPVVYFLHGLNNDHTSWTVERYGNIHNKVEEMILAKKVPELILVCPKGDHSFYCNYADGSQRYEDLITKDLLAHIESTYRAKKGRENRSIGGTSMGGYGALKIGMKMPEQYSAAVGHSPIIFLGKNPLDVPEEMKSARFYQFFVGILKPLFGEPIQQELWDANNPLLLAKKGGLGSLKIHFDFGTDDRYIQSIHLDRGIRALDQALTEAGVAHSFKVYQGEPHGWALVSAHLSESLPFLCQSF